MTIFTMKLAGVVIKAEVSFKTTKSFCSSYLCDAPAELELSVSSEDIAAERGKMKKENPSSDTSDACLERLALYRKIVSALTPYDVILFHGSAIEADGGAYIFTAPSGTGKSTHAALWRQVYGQRVKMINDDKPLIRFFNTGPVIYGTPWSGKHGLERNVSIPVKAVCLLNRGSENRMEKISGPDAFPAILRQTHIPENGAPAAKAVSLAAELADRAECWKMYCNMETSAAEMSFETMVEGKQCSGNGSRVLPG